MDQKRSRASQDSANSKQLKFTKTNIDALTAPEGARQTYFHDTLTRGFCICVSKTGKKSFYCLRKFKGRTERVLIGRYPETTIAQARQRAGHISSQFDAGLNVNEIKRQERGELTLQDAFNEYMARHAKVYNRHWKQSEDLFQLHLSPWANRRLSSIGKHDVAKWHAGIGRDRGHYTANNGLTLMKAIFNRMIDWDLFRGVNPTNATRKFRTVSRDRYLYPDELRRFLNALKVEADSSTRDLFLLLLLTGARKSNCLAMKWHDLNLEAGIWTIPVTKNGDPQNIPLSPQAISILRQRAFNAVERANENTQRLSEAVRNARPSEPSATIQFNVLESGAEVILILKSEYVFPGTGQSGHVADPRKPWRRLLERASIVNFRVHDLRRTHGSYLAATGANHFVISRALGHKDMATTAIYARLDLDPIRAATNKATNVMLAGVDGLLPI